MAVTENATIAQTYDTKVRNYANELSKFRQRETEIIKLLNEEDQRIKREVLRECQGTSTFVPKKQPPNKGRKGDQGKDGKGKHRKGDKGQGKGGYPKKKPWKGKNSGWDSDWYKNDWGKNNDWSEGNSNKNDGSKPSEQQEEKTETQTKKKKNG